MLSDMNYLALIVVSLLLLPTTTRLKTILDLLYKAAFKARIRTRTRTRMRSASALRNCALDEIKPLITATFILWKLAVNLTLAFVFIRRKGGYLL